MVPLKFPGEPIKKKMEQIWESVKSAGYDIQMQIRQTVDHGICIRKL